MQEPDLMLDMPLGAAPDASMGIAFTLIGLAVYAYVAIALAVIARKTGTPGGWLAWIPVANVVLMCRIASMHWFWVLVTVVPLVNIVAALALFMGMAKARGKSPALAWLLLVPGVGLIVPGLLAIGGGSPVPGRQPAPRQEGAPAAPAEAPTPVPPPSHCSRCGAPLEAEDAFCGECGKSLSAPEPPCAASAVCPECGSPDCVGQAFCGTTGRPLQGAALPPPTGVDVTAAAPARSGWAGKLGVAAVVLGAGFLLVGLGSFVTGLVHSRPDTPQLPAEAAQLLAEFPASSSRRGYAPPSVWFIELGSASAATAFQQIEPEIVPRGLTLPVMRQVAERVAFGAYDFSIDSETALIVLETKAGAGSAAQPFAQLLARGSRDASPPAPVRLSSPKGAVYEGFRVDSPFARGYVLAKAGARTLVVVWTHAPDDHEELDEYDISFNDDLAADVGNAGGLLDDPESGSLAALLPPASLHPDPPRPPVTGFVLLPGWRARYYAPRLAPSDGPDDPDNGASLLHRIEADLEPRRQGVILLDFAGEPGFLLVAEFGNPLEARWKALWLRLASHLAGRDVTPAEVGGARVTVIDDGVDALGFFRRGPYVVLLQPANDSRLDELIGSLPI